MSSPVRADAPRRRPSRERSPPRTPTASPPSTRATTSSRRCPSPSSSRRWTRRPPTTCGPLRTASTLPRLPHRSRSSCRPTRSPGPTTGSTSTTPEVKTMRIQNFGSWSPYMVKDGRNVLGLEYTVVEGDELVDRSGRGADRAGQAGARGLGLVNAGRRRGRLRRAHAEGVPDLRRRLQGATSTRCGAGSSRRRPTCIPSGRNGMHRYNNQDHSMYTAMLTVENI